MTLPNSIVFLVDVDNTLLDNDRVTADLRDHLEREVGHERQERYWKIFEQRRSELGYADYLGAFALTTGIGADDLVNIVLGGTIDFDRCIATPDMMPLVGRLGKVLGPRGMMPNPKVGTVTMDVKSAVEAAKGGEVQFKVEKAGVIHAGIGKVSFDEAKLAENVRAFVDAVAKAKPAGAKGTYVKKVSLSSTMGPGVSLDIASATA